MGKQDLTFSSPFMNAAGILGYAPDYRYPVPWESFGAFVTNPLSFKPRKPAVKPALIEYSGGFLLHTGLPNPSLKAAIKKYARRWNDSHLPIIPHLMADNPHETSRMVQSLEDLENVIALELGFAPLMPDELILSVIESSQGELPLIICLSLDQVLSLGSQVIRAGATAISLAAPRGMLLLGNGQQVTGRLNGASLFPQTLLVIREAVQNGLPVIGRGGLAYRDQAQAILSVGAMAVQLDCSLWRGDLSPWAPAP